MPRKMVRDMEVHDIELKKAVSAGVSYDSPLIKRHFDPVVIKELEGIRNKKIERQRISEAQKALLDRYNETHATAVANTIDEIIDEDIIKIREIIQNMIDYGDARVFKVVPSELDAMMKTYGVVAQEHFKSLLGGTNGSHVFVIPTTYKRCTCCQRFKAPRFFVTTNSDMCSDGRAGICKDCANKLFNKYLKKYKDIREVLILMSHKLDLYVYEPTLEKFVRHYDTSSGKDDVIGNLFLSKYVSELYLQKYFNPDLKEYNFEHTKLEGVPFKCVKAPSLVPQIYHDKFIVEVVTEESATDAIDKEIADDEKPLSQGAIKRLEYKFGKYDPIDLRWLERRYREFEEAYDITELSTKKLVNQLCCQELVIIKKREQGIDVDKQYKSYIETMKALNLTPKQQARTSTANGFSSIGEFTREAEKHGPIIERAKEFNDVDGINRIIIGITGGIARTLGKRNEYSDAFEKIYQEYSSSLLDMDTGDDDEE